MSTCAFVSRLYVSPCQLYLFYLFLTYARFNTHLILFTKTMSDEEKKVTNNEDDEIEEDDASKKKVAGKHDSSAADLARVTNYGFFDEEGQTDSSTKEISGAMSILDSKRSKEDAERVARQKELAKVTVRKEDVDLIMQEMDIPRGDAEMKLRHAMGNVVQALVELIN